MKQELDLTPRQLIATTHMVQQSVLTIECLHNMAASVNERDHKPSMLVEHNHLCPPLGQTVACQVLPTDDGHHALYAQYDIFPPPTPITLPDWEEAFQQQSEKNTYRFATAEFHHPRSFCVGIDPTSLGGVEQTEALFVELRAIADLETQQVMRRSILPDPMTIFTLSAGISATWFGTSIAKATAEAVEPALKKFISAMITTITRMALEALPKYRPITYVLQVHGEPNLEFVARTRDADAVIKALTARDLGELQPRINSLHKQLNAEMIQFYLQENGSWAFNFLLTKDGKVIGVRKAFDERAILLQDMQNKRQLNQKNIEDA